MNDLKLVSVIMPVFNTALYLKEAIESILNQTYHHFEFLIFNDGSTDDCDGIIRSYNDKRIVYNNSPQNMGYVHWLNEGLKMAKGSFIARMDSDDIALPLRFEKQVEILNKFPGIGVCGSWVQLLNGNSKMEVWQYSEKSQHIKADFIFENPIAHPAVMMRKSLLMEYSLKYNIDYFPAEDYHLWYQLNDITEFYNIPEVLLYYRIHSNQTSFVSDKQGEPTKKIRKLFLLHSGLDLGQDLKDFEIIIDAWQRTEPFLHTAGKYLNDLAIKNEQLKHFDNAHFRRKIQTLFWRQCYFATKKGVNGLKIYNEYVFDGSYKISVKDRIKIFLKKYREN